MKDITIKMSLGMLCVCCTFFAAAQPVASFLINAPSSTCTPATFSFSNLSSGEGALNFDWQFGDNTATDTSTNPFHTYQECGSFEVILSVTDTTGQIAADTQQVIINCTPIAAFNFSPTVICDSAMVHFTDLSVPADSIVAWQWNFGDPVSGAADTSLIKNPTHYYHTPGLFSISLSVTSIDGCLSVATDSILVIQPQAYYALMNSACVNDSTFFIDLSTSQDAIVSWFWNFDDPASGNNTSNVQYPAHVFSQAGDYNVRLTISTETGCTNVWQKYIHVYGLPLVNAGSDQSMCAFDSVQLEASGALVYEWQPESLLSNALVPNPFAFPLNTQDFFVTGTDENGCSAQDTVKVTVLALPQASAGNDTAICEGTSVLLNGSGGISFQWSPANTLDNDTIAQPLATPDSNTTYIVTVKDESGCSASDSVTVQVSPFPVVSIFGINAQYCSNGDSVELNALPSGGLFSGDGVMNNFLHPAMLSAGGPYSIVYSFTNETGCTADDTALFFIVAPMPITISTTDSLLCLNGTAISFELFPEGGILSGNGINNNLFDPSLAGAGMHQVYYQVTDTNNCKAFDSLKITVFELPAVSAGNDTVICSGDSIELQATGGLNYSWSPAASLTDSAISNPVAFPLVATQYEVLVVDSNGCSNKDSVLITVFSIANVDAGMNDTICKGDTIPLTATGGAAYAWSPSEGLSATNISNPYAFPEITTMYTVTVNSGSSCPGLDSVLITVNALPAVNAGNDQSLCNGDSVQLAASGATNYTWQPSINLSNSEVAEPFAFPETSTYYTVAGTDTNGCSAIDSVLINVLSLPVIDAGNDTSICAGDTLQ
ncbi:MAG: PKD domain-containing protein, partial [Chitinophagales bacterium]